MKSKEIRERFLQFFKDKDHAIIASASLLPENDPSVLFNTAGMQPLVPYLLGEKHPAGTRLANSQKCVRTGDIDEIGDATHATFFEMLGNWSLGDYFKKEAIQWSYELLTDKGKGFGLDPERLYVTCFEGDENAPRDEESAQIWRDIFEKNNVTGERIYFLPAKNNWWSAGDNGPCGPDTEMFYDVTGTLDKGLSFDEYIKADDEQKVVEIWNDVFMEYLKKDGKVVGKLEKQNVDTGSGLERVTMVLQGKDNIFDTDLFTGIRSVIQSLSTNNNLKSERIIADHIRASVFMIADGAYPSNTDQGYVLRRLLRRAVRHSDILGMPAGSLSKVAKQVVADYGDVYQNLKEKESEIISVIEKEEEKFRSTLTSAMKMFDRMVAHEKKPGERVVRNSSDLALKDPNILSCDETLLLVATYGMPLELVLEIAKEKNITVDVDGFNAKFAEHKEASKLGSDKKFKGGMAGNSEMEIKFHTATHLLNAALRKVLGDHIEQKGSNITPDRLRFDFSHGEKMTDEQKAEVETIVNDAIAKDYPVSWSEMPIEEARDKGAIGVFGDKYGEVVKVYQVGNDETGVFSMELCGGPHVERTGILGTFKIKKEEASSAGVRRIKAVLN